MRPSSTLAEELAEREGFELGGVTLRISKLHMHKDGDVLCTPRSPLICHQICHHAQRKRGDGGATFSRTKRSEEDQQNWTRGGQKHGAQSEAVTSPRI
jgi:hypothetical protein